HTGLDRGTYFGGYVFHVLQNDELNPRTFRFLRPGRRVEPILHVVLAVGGKVVDALLCDVMIGKDQSVGRQKRRRAVGRASRGKPHVVKPGLVGGKAILGLDFVLGESVKQPHTFVGKGEAAQAERKDAEQQNETFNHDDSERETRVRDCPVWG